MSVISMGCERTATAELPSVGIRISHPVEFHIGRFAVVEPTPEFDLSVEELNPYLNAAVLVSDRHLGDHPIDTIPIGAVPSITFDTTSAAIHVIDLAHADSTFEVSAGEVFVFPGFPGVFGDQAHYYIVRLNSGRLVEVTAHRFAFTESDPPPPTHFDRIVEEILSTIEELP